VMLKDMPRTTDSLRINVCLSGKLVHSLLSTEQAGSFITTKLVLCTKHFDISLYGPLKTYAYRACDI
jgi:hypothetical protein